MRKYVIIGGVLVFLLALILVASYLSNSIGSAMNGAGAQVDANMAADYDWAVENAVDVGTRQTGSIGAGAAPPEIYCDVLNDRTTPAQCDYFKEIRAKLATGEAALDIPDPIVRGETATVSFVVSRDPTSTPVGELLGSAPDDQFKLKVGRWMAAQLKGDGFEIEPADLQARDLFVGDGARWDWQVTPKRALKYRLILSAYVVVGAADGSKKETLLKSVERVVPVQVTWGQWFDDFFTDTTPLLEKALTWWNALKALVLGLGLGAIWKYRKKIGAFFKRLVARDRKEQPPAS